LEFFLLHQFFVFVPIDAVGSAQCTAIPTEREPYPGFGYMVKVTRQKILSQNINKKIQKQNDFLPPDGVLGIQFWF